MKNLMARFGLHALPFTRELPVERRFAHPLFDQAREILVGAVQKRMSTALIGPAGTGKSALRGAVRSPSTRRSSSRWRITRGRGTSGSFGTRWSG